MIFLVLFLLVPAIWAQTCSKSRVVSCAMTYVDTNQDSIVTTEELDNFIMEGPCGVIDAATGAGIMEFCDFNRDGHLTAVDDVDPADAPCLYSEPLMKMVCDQCDKCDTMAKKK